MMRKSTEWVVAEPSADGADTAMERYSTGDEAAFAEATTSAEGTTLTDATGCTSGGGGPLSLALMAAALASRARARRRIRRI